MGLCDNSLPSSPSSYTPSVHTSSLFVIPECGPCLISIGDRGTTAPISDKRTRFAAQSIKFEAGNVYLPTGAPWLEEYIREMTGFPGTKYDDQVDSTSQALENLSPKAHAT